MKILFSQMVFQSNSKYFYVKCKINLSVVLEVSKCSMLLLSDQKKLHFCEACLQSEVSSLISSPAMLMSLFLSCVDVDLPFLHNFKYLSLFFDLFFPHL